MENNYINDIVTLFKNVTLNSMGAEKTLYQYLEGKDVSKAIRMMDNNDKEVDNALMEYNPQNHPVMKRPNKQRKDDKPYITEKLPRTRERYINEIELFFLLGKPIMWEQTSGDPRGKELFMGFLRKHRINSMLRKVKRLAGAETEAALIFHLSNKNGNMNVKPFVVARSLGYRIRTMFNQYGDLIALAYGYRTRSGEGKTIQHWDILTKDFIFECTNGKNGYEVEMFQNPTGKINAVYFKQPKAWDGAVPRMRRLEMLDSKTGDTNNYFSDPMAAATADVVDNLADPDKPGRLIQLTTANSKFEYINPPQNSMSRVEEKSDLDRSILFDTFTPDLSYDSLKGMGSLSGAALRNALVLAYIKRGNLQENYGEMVDRLRSVIVELLKITEPSSFSVLSEMVLDFEFAEPFEDSIDVVIERVVKMRTAGLMSLETAVNKLSQVDDVEMEIDRLFMEQQELEYEKNLAVQESNEAKERMKNEEH